MLARSTGRHPEKTALVCAKQRLSYRDLAETSDRLACRFLRGGHPPLDRVVVQLPNVPEFVHTYFALTRIGAIPVTALRAHRHTEIRHFVRASGAAAYVIPDRIGAFDYRTMAAEIQRGFRRPCAPCSWPASPRRDSASARDDRCAASGATVHAALAALRPIRRKWRRCCSRAAPLRCRN